MQSTYTLLTLFWLCILNSAYGHTAPIPDAIEDRNPVLEKHEAHAGQHGHYWCYDDAVGRSRALAHWELFDDVTQTPPETPQTLETPIVAERLPPVPPPNPRPESTLPVQTFTNIHKITETLPETPQIPKRKRPASGVSSEKGSAEIQEIPDTHGSAETQCGKRFEAVKHPLEIVSVVEMRNPRRLLVTVRNHTHRFIGFNICWEICLLDRQGQTKVRRLFNRTKGTPIVTYQKNRKAKYAPAEATFILLPKIHFEKIDFNADQARFAVAFNYYYGKRIGTPGYNAGDILVLKRVQKKNQDTDVSVEVSRYPESIAMSPKRIWRLTTTWGAIKRESVDRTQMSSAFSRK